VKPMGFLENLYAKMLKKEAELRREYDAKKKAKQSEI